MQEATSTKRNMVTRRVGSLLILRHNTESPTDAEWDECLTELEKMRTTETAVKVLVITDLGSPNGAQRKRLQQALEGWPVPVAVVSNNTRVRFISATLALLNRRQRSFSEAQMDEVFGYLGVSKDQDKHVSRIIEEMKRLVS